MNRVRELDSNAVCPAIIDDVGFGVDGRRASLQQSIQLDSARGDEQGGHRVLRYLTLQGHRLLQLPVHATNDSVRVLASPNIVPRGITSAIGAPLIYVSPVRLLKEKECQIDTLETPPPVDTEKHAPIRTSGHCS